MYFIGLITEPIPINKVRLIILEPTIFPKNNSFSFFLAEIIPVIISGRAVPTAIMVIPIKLSEKPKSLAIKVALFTTKSEPNLRPNKPSTIYKIIIIIEFSFNSIFSTSFINSLSNSLFCFSS